MNGRHWLFVVCLASCGGKTTIAHAPSAPPVARASAPPPATQPGRVIVRRVRRKGEGAPVSGALVALVPPKSENATAIATSGPGGRVELDVPDGEYAITTTAAGLTAAFIPMAPFKGPTQDVEIKVGGPGVTVT